MDVEGAWRWSFGERMQPSEAQSAPFSTAGAESQSLCRANFKPQRRDRHLPLRVQDAGTAISSNRSPLPLTAQTMSLRPLREQVESLLISAPPDVLR